MFPAGISPALDTDQGDFTYRASVSEVSVSFSAMDQNNRGMANLPASDFAVVDKDVIARNLLSFTRSESTKLEIAIRVDARESVKPRFRQEAGAGLLTTSRPKSPTSLAGPPHSLGSCEHFRHCVQVFRLYFAGGNAHVSKVFELQQQVHERHGVD